MECTTEAEKKNERGMLGVIVMDEVHEVLILGISVVLMTLQANIPRSVVRVCLSINRLVTIQ